MRVYILDLPCRSREQIVSWLSEDCRVSEVKVFEDYIRLVEQAESSPPDLCIIRLGSDGIPGLKAAEMLGQIGAGIRIVFISRKKIPLDAYEAELTALCSGRQQDKPRIFDVNSGDEANE